MPLYGRLSFVCEDGVSWRTIDSAPRDGTEFLGFCPEMSLYQVIDYDPSENNPDWVWAVCDGATYHKDAFTHWQPLPEPPREPEAQDKIVHHGGVRKP